MTKIQIVEFSKLELQYLEQVKLQNVEEQLRWMEVIFFWLKKQQQIARASVLNRPDSPEITPTQKGEFTYLQMDMVTAACRNDTEKMIEVERMMRDWIDTQLSRSVNKDFKPKMKITRNYGKN
jgi:hypothetical protein